MSKRSLVMLSLVVFAAAFLQSCANPGAARTSESKNVQHAYGPHQTGTNL